MGAKGRRLALVLGVGGIVVTVSLALILKDRIAEEYWLRVLSTGNESEKTAAIEKLGVIGGAKSGFRISEDRMRRLGEEAGEYMLPGLPGFAYPRDATNFKRRMLPGTSEALTKIQERVGWKRYSAQSVEILDDETFDLSLRLAMAQQIVMIATNPLDRPDPFKRTFPGGTEGPPEGKERIAWAQKAKTQAIAVLVEALRSDNSFYRKAAVYSLSLCGPEAETALPALKEVMAADEDEEIRRYAGVAVQHIVPGDGSVGGQRVRGAE